MTSINDVTNFFFIHALVRSSKCQIWILSRFVIRYLFFWGEGGVGPGFRKGVLSRELMFRGPGFFVLDPVPLVETKL